MYTYMCREERREIHGKKEQVMRKRRETTLFKYWDRVKEKDKQGKEREE